MQLLYIKKLSKVYLQWDFIISLRYFFSQNSSNNQCRYIHFLMKVDQ